LRSDAVRLRNCLRALTDGTGDGDAGLIAEGRRAVEETGYLDHPTARPAEDGLRKAAYYWRDWFETRTTVSIPDGPEKRLAIVIDAERAAALTRGKP
jgi:hypothetical protein